MAPDAPDTHTQASPPVAELEAAVATATRRLLATAAALDDEAVRRPSLLPGWTRAHVLTHVARTGEPRWQYASWEQREADIEAGARRPGGQLVEDLTTSAERFADEARRLEPVQWEQAVSPMPGAPAVPARQLLRARLTEVEVHHADLGAGYGPGDWAEQFVRLLLDRVRDDRRDGPGMVVHATDLSAEWVLGDGAGPRVTGPAAALAWWLTGRGDGDGLVSSEGPLPELDRWR